MLALLLACADPAPPPDPTPTPPAAAPDPSTGMVTIDGVNVSLELGRWTVGSVEALLRETASLAPEARLDTIAQRFVGTPFAYESLSPIPPPGTLRVRLDSFDCTTFVIHALALAHATDFASYVATLRTIRYATPEIDSDPATGTILDFASDILIDGAVANGVATDVTAEVAGDVPLTRFRARQEARRRTRAYDLAERLVVPRLHPMEVVELAMIARESLARIDATRFHSGDILAFSRVDPAAPVGSDLLIGHLAVAQVVDGHVHLLHSTRDYLWRPDAQSGTPPSGTGRYYLDDPRREQLGVARATAWVTDPEGRRVEIDGEPYYGYDGTTLRPLADYMAGAHIHGVLVLRPTPPRPHPAPVPAPETPVVDAAMTREQAMEGVSPDCPASIADRQDLYPVRYRSMDGALHEGQMVTDHDLREEVEAAFAVIRRSGFPIVSAIPIADLRFRRDGKWDDDASMDVGNSSGFNYRTVADSTNLSKHACGTAIDLNTRLNPYIRTRNGIEIVAPPGATYDPAVPGTFTAEHIVTRTLRAMGWTWGGTWQSVKDWQHFEKPCP